MKDKDNKKKNAPEAVQPEQAAADTAEKQAAENQAAGQEKSEDSVTVTRAKLEELNAFVKSAEAKRDEYLSMAQRVQADFENFRRRNNAVRADAYEDGARAFIKTILPVMDNLERALAAESADAALHEGVSMVHRQLSEALEKRGVTVIDCAGEKFDPRLEDAVMQADASEGEPGTVCLVLQKGYQLGDVVLRHAMVKVVAEA